MKQRNRIGMLCTYYIYQYIYQKDTYCRLIYIKPILFIFLYSTTCYITINYFKNNS